MIQFRKDIHDLASLRKRCSTRLYCHVILIMAKYIQIKLDNPCQQKWEDLQPGTAGNFCSSCQKTVIDFTGMTDNQLMEYFSKKPFAVCGRIFAEQLETPLPLPVKRIPWIKYFFQVALPAMLLSYKATAQQLVKRNLYPIVLHQKGQPVAAAKFAILSGRITNSTGSPIPYASFMADSTGEGTTADDKGVFHLRLTHSVSILHVFAVGYQKRDVQVKGADTINELSIPLQANVNLSNRCIVVGGMSTVRVTKRHNIISNKVEISPSIEIFPNPAARNSVLTLRWKQPVSKTEEISLYNVAGSLLQQQKLTITSPTREIELNFKPIAAGTYFIHVIDLKNKKKEILKLIFY